MLDNMKKKELFYPSIGFLFKTKDCSFFDKLARDNGNII